MSDIDRATLVYIMTLNVVYYRY